MPIEINLGLRVACQLTAALQTALSDGEGIMKCFQWNGHGSMRPCVGHCKCFQEGERHCRCLTCSPNRGGGEQEQTWCDCLSRIWAQRKLHSLALPVVATTRANFNHPNKGLSCNDRTLLRQRDPMGARPPLRKEKRIISHVIKHTSIKIK